jgi:hypothetical protein
MTPHFKMASVQEKVSGLKIIGHGNFDSNLESLYISVICTITDQENLINSL